MRLTRRQALALAVLGVPTAGAAALAFRQGGDPGELVTPEERSSLGPLSLREYATLKVVIARIARRDRADLPLPEVVGAAPFAARYLAGLHPIDLADFKHLLAVIEHLLPIAHGTTLPFTRAGASVQDAVLSGLEQSEFTLLRGGFAALKQTTALAYFRAPETWRAIGYPGPLVAPSSDPRPREVYGTPIRKSAEHTFDVDAVVVGSGAGGSMVAREIARSGARVLLLEEGPDHPPESFTQREDEMLPVLFQDRGGRATRDRAVQVLQGRGLGGSTIHNTNLCKRAPAAILDGWRAAGLHGWDAASMEPLFAEVEALLHVTDIADADVNANNAALRRGAEALGWRSGRLRHNRDGCRRSGFCELGCAYDGKNNARKIVIPDAVRAGAMVRTDTRVERVITERGRAIGVDARDKRTGSRVRVRARAVVLAASAVGSAAIAIASDLPDPLGRQGYGLHLHPGAAVAGIFDHTIDGFSGIPQSWECTEWLQFDPDSDRRVWIVPAFAHPVGTSAMLPGVGPAWTGGMRNYPRMAVLTAMLHDETNGRVVVEYGRPVLDYSLIRGDRDQLARGLRACAEILLAAGARSVVFPFAPPVRVRRASELNWLDGRMLDPLAIPLTAVHPMSAMRAGDDPAHSVCDPHGQHHHVRGLYVADGGLFPTSLGSPPQISIYTTGLKVGRHVVEDLRRS